MATFLLTYAPVYWATSIFILAPLWRIIEKLFLQLRAPSSWWLIAGGGVSPSDTTSGRPGQKGLFFTVFYPGSGGFLFANERREKQRGVWFGVPVLPIKHLHSQYSRPFFLLIARAGTVAGCQFRSKHTHMRISHAPLFPGSVATSMMPRGVSFKKKCAPTR